MWGRCWCWVGVVLIAIGQKTYGMEYKFRYYTDTDGLSSNTIQCLYQDDKGYIWVGTADGLDRFNSHDFTNYRSDYRRSYSIRNNCIYSICGEGVDSDRICVGTSDGVFIFDPRTERFEALPIKINGQTKYNLLVYTMAADTGGNLWIGTFGDGLFRYNQRSGEVEHYSAEKYPNVFASDVIVKILLDHDNNIWVAANNGSSICKYSPENNRFVPFKVEDPLRHTAIGRISTMCQDSFGDIWIAGYSSELYKFEISRFTFTQNAPPLDAEYGRVRGLVEYSPGVLMLGTDHGLICFNAKNRSFEQIDSGTTNRTGRLNDKFIHSLLKDREGGVWIGTYFGGINYLSPLSSLFASIEPRPGCGRIISKFSENPDGTIWIGSDDGGLSLYDPRTGDYKQVVIDPLHPALNIHALTVEGDHLWVGTYGNGLYRMNLLDRKVQHFDRSDNRQDALDTYSVFRDSRGQLWIGTKMGICRYDDRTGQIVCVAELGHNSDVVDICEDTHANVWFASQGKGLIRYNLDKGAFTYFSRDGRYKMSDFVSCLAVENDRLWIGTLGNGLCCYDICSDSVTRDLGETPYENCAVFQIIQSGGDLWLTTNKGLLKYTPSGDRKPMFKYTAEDGLLANIFNANSGFKASTGHIYIGCNSGINKFYPYDFVRRENSTKLSVVFLDFKLSNRSVPVGGELLPTTIDCQRQITIRGQKVSFSLDFIALNFSSPLRTVYRYRLENFDEKWLSNDASENSGVQHVSYTNLPPNHYRFVISAVSGSDQPGETAVVEITVLPPWWMSRTMVGIYTLLCLVGFLGGGYRFLRRIGRAHNEQIASITRKNKLDLLEAKVNLFSEVAAEIRTPVSLISAPMEQIANCPELPEQLKDDVLIIRKNCGRLLHLVDQILGLRDSEVDFVPQVEIGKDMSKLFRSAIDDARNVVVRQGVNLKCNLPEIAFRADICGDYFRKIIGHILNNALRYAESLVEVWLESPVKECGVEWFCVRIRDDGAGIRTEDREKIFGLFYTGDQCVGGADKRLGIGLAIVRNLVDKAGAEINVESVVGQWTEFTVKFPVVVPESGPCDGQQLHQTGPPSLSQTGKEQPVLLLLEQNADFVEFFVRHLSARFLIVCASDGQEALDLLHRRNIAVVVCESALQGMDGIAFCAAVKADEALDHIPVIVLSVDVSAATKIRALQAGAEVYLEKPVSMGYLESQLYALIGMHNRLRSKFSKLPYFRIDEQDSASSESRFMTQVNQYIIDNISNSALSVDDVVAALHVGRTLFFNRIKILTGMTPNEFLRSMRLKTAAELLAASNNLRVTEICYMVGFTSASYFAKCFSAQFGMLPNEFMEKYRKN